MAGFIATGSARKTFEKMFFDRLDDKNGKKPKNKGGDSIWDTITEKAPDSKTKDR